MKENNENMSCAGGLGCKVSVCLHEFTKNGSLCCIKCGQTKP